MPKNFIPCDRDQQRLLPIDMREWLPKNHLVWFVIDSVKLLNLEAFYRVYRDDGWGRAAYNPAMMVTLLLYAYSIGVRSAREIERRTAEHAPFRIITDDRIIDHATICRFRTRHRDALSELFVGVLGLCADAGIVRPAVVAIDGTKVAANASADRNLTREQLEEFARRVFDEAEAIDAHEDELYGDKRGDELPEHLIDEAARIEWLKNKIAERQLEANAKAKNRSQRKARVNTTDPDSALQKARHGYLQGYNGQLAVTPAQIVVAADLTADNNDNLQFKAMVTQATDNLEAVAADGIGTVVADAGYFDDTNTFLELGPRLLITPVSSRNLDEAIATREPVVADPAAHARWVEDIERLQLQADARQRVVDGYVARHVTAQEAAQALGVTIGYVYALKWRLTRRGHLRQPPPPPPPPRPTATQVMLERFAKPGAVEVYRMRAKTVEPVIGQLKHDRGLRQFVHRGEAACRCEFIMMNTGHNLRKLWTSCQESLGTLFCALFPPTARAF